MADAGKSELMQRLLGAGSEQGDSSEESRPFGGLVVDGGMGTELKKTGCVGSLAFQSAFCDEPMGDQRRAITRPA